MILPRPWMAIACLAGLAAPAAVQARTLPGFLVGPGEVIMLDDAVTDPAKFNPQDYAAYLSLIKALGEPAQRSPAHTYDNVPITQADVLAVISVFSSMSFMDLAAALRPCSKIFEVQNTHPKFAGEIFFVTGFRCPDRPTDKFPRTLVIGMREHRVVGIFYHNEGPVGVVVVPPSAVPR